MNRERSHYKYRMPAPSEAPAQARGRIEGRGAGRPAPERGVTLTEILVVLAIMGLFMLVALPALGNYIRAGRIRSSNDTLMGDLRLVRYIAITNRTNSTITFDGTARSWTYTDIHGRTITRTLEMGANFSTLTNVPVTFKSDGSISTLSPTIIIQGSPATGVVHTYTITVSPVGKVTSVWTRT